MGVTFYSEVILRCIRELAKHEPAGKPATDRQSQQVASFMVSVVFASLEVMLHE